MKCTLMVLLACAAAGATAQQNTVILPRPAPGALDNPLKGWCPFTESGTQISQPIGLAYVQSTWRQLEPERGHYAFGAWEKNAWETPAAKGKHIVFRVWLDYPHETTGVPQWLLDAGLKTTPYTDWGGGRSPDYADPRLQKGVLDLIAAMGARYDSNPRVAFIQLGLLGFWGEWHTYPRTELFAPPSFQQAVIDAYHKAFPHKLLMGRTATGYMALQPWLGFHDDMIPEDSGGKDEWNFLPQIDAAKRDQNWKVACLGGEMVPGAAKRYLGTDFKLTMDTVSQVHFSFIGPYGPSMVADNSPEFLANSQALVRHLGYEYRLTKCQWTRSPSTGSPLEVQLEGTNQGVAPFYYSWPVRFALIDATGKVAETWTVAADIRNWLPGSFSLISKHVLAAKPGNYRLAFGIEDPWTGKPAIRLANDLPSISGWNILGNLPVGNRSNL